MKNYASSGYMYEQEEDLKELVSIDEYLDTLYGRNINSKHDGGYSGEDSKWPDIEDVEPVDYSSFNLDDALPSALYDMRTKYLEMTQQEFAKIIGISVATLSKVEKGNLNVTKNTLTLIKAYLGVD